MRHLRVPLFLVLFLLLATALAPSPAVEAQAQVQGIAGWTGQVEVEGDVLYVHTRVEGDRTQLLWKVYDISDALAPVQIGELPGFAAIKVEGDLAYGITIQSDGTHIAIVDVSDPANPRFLDQSLVPPGIYWFGHGQVYLRETGYDSAEWLHIYRLDDDGHPQFMSTYTVKEEPGPSVEPSATGESMDDATIMALDWPYLYYSGVGPIDVSDPENPVATSLGGVAHRSIGAWSVKDRIGYGQIGPYPYECGPQLAITDTKNRWEGFITFDAFVSGGAPANSFEMAWNTYLMVGSTGGTGSYECPGTPHFEILDFSRFSFATGEGSISIIYQDELPIDDSAYHEGEGVIYVSRGDGGVDIMQAPFPTLNRHTYFPLAAR